MMQRRSSRPLTIVLSIIFLSLVACSSDGSGIQEVTAIPQGQAQDPTATTALGSTSTPTATFDVAAITDVPSQAPATATATVAPTEVAAGTTPTPTPLQEDLEGGLSRAQAAATDAAFQPTPQNTVVFDNFPVRLEFDDFYSGFDMRRGWQMSDKLVALDGKQVVMEGYVAPPLKPRLDFFVLTQVQLAFCPFCSTDADWPDRIALVYLPEEDIISSEYPVRVTGRLEIGSSIDAETGMVSLVRLYLEDLETIN